MRCAFLSSLLLVSVLSSDAFSRIPAAPKIRLPATSAATDMQSANKATPAHTRIALPRYEDLLQRIGVSTDKIHFDAEVLSFEPATKASTAVIFAHGFSQRSENYMSTLQLLAGTGHHVLAVETSMTHVCLPWVDVPLSSPMPSNLQSFITSSMPAKLQTAMILDVLRAALYAKEELGVENVMLCGHSMGGASSLVALSLVNRQWPWLRSAVVMSPAIALARTTLNDRLYAEAGSASVADETMQKFFKTFCSNQVRILMMSAEKDRLVPPQSLRSLAKAVFEAHDYDNSNVMACLLAQLLTGSHIGFEDSIRLSGVPVIDAALDAFYKLLRSSMITGNFDWQRLSAHALLLEWCLTIGNEHQTNDKEFEQLKELSERKRADVQFQFYFPTSLEPDSVLPTTSTSASTSSNNSDTVAFTLRGDIASPYLWRLSRNVKQIQNAWIEFQAGNRGFPSNQ